MFRFFGLLVTVIFGLSLNPAAYGNGFVITAPSTCENGAVCPINIDVTPSLKGGDSFVVFINEQEANIVHVISGELSHFSTRYKTPKGMSKIEVRCLTCALPPQAREVTTYTGAELSKRNAEPKNILLRATRGDLRVLVEADETISGFAYFDTETTKVLIKHSPFTVKNPFFGIKGAFPEGNHCFAFGNSEIMVRCIGQARSLSTTPKDLIKLADGLTVNKPVIDDNDGLLELAAATWVQIVRNNGEKVNFSAVQGQRIEFSSTSTAALVFGQPDKARVTIRGKPVDLTPFITGHTPQRALVIIQEINKSQTHADRAASQTKSTAALKLIVSSTAPDSNGVVTLNITTGADTASLRINGDEEGGRADGRYSVTRFARIGSNQFEIIATDRFGNTQRQNISVNRQVADSTVRFSQLNPLSIRPRAPRDAVAIIIGIQDYRRVPKADFANNDARAFYDYAVRGLGIRGENIKMLLDQEADEVGILSALKNWLPLKVRKNQTEVFVFYSGHGLPSNDGASLYLLPYGVDRQFLERTAINQAELIAALQTPQPRSVTMFLDACYSGQSRGGEMLLASARPIVVQAKASSFPANFTVISASAPEELASSSPELKHGIFSYWLMKGIEGEADTNKDGQITAAELREYLSDSVGRMSAAQGRLQRPQAVGELSRVVVQR